MPVDAPAPHGGTRYSLLTDAADAAPIRNLGTPSRRRLFERARFLCVLGIKGGRVAPVPPGNIPTGLKFDQGREELGTTLGCCSLTYITTVRLRVLRAAIDRHLPARHENAAHAGDAIGFGSGPFRTTLEPAEAPPPADDAGCSVVLTGARGYSAARSPQRRWLGSRARRSKRR